MPVMKVEGVVTAWNGMLCLELTADSGGTYRRSSFSSVCEVERFLQRVFKVGFSARDAKFFIHEFDSVPLNNPPQSLAVLDLRTKKRVDCSVSLYR